MLFVMPLKVNMSFVDSNTSINLLVETIVKEMEAKIHPIVRAQLEKAARTRINELRL